MQEELSNVNRTLCMCWKKCENFNDSVIRRNHFLLRIKKNIDQVTWKILIINDGLAIWYLR